MDAIWNKAANQRMLCTAPYIDFAGKAFVIVIPDIQPGYNSLPNVNTYAGFLPLFLNTTLGEVTNAVEQQPNTIFFEPGSISTISAIGQPNCLLGSGSPPPQVAAPQISLAQAGFCLVQPSIGGQTTDNSALFSDNSYTNCIQSGAQFVAVNLFSHNTSDGPLTTFFDPAYFGKYSFKKGT
jgi:hypothetical protein